MDSSSESRNWADVPIELLGLILNRLVLVPDLIRFRAVCKPWSLVKQEECSNSSSKDPPMLLIPTDDWSKDYMRLYSIWENKIYPHRLQIPHRRRCCGSSYGWLAYVEKNDVSLKFWVNLLNPFSNTTIYLPTIMEIPYFERDYHDPEYYLKKVILSCDPCLYPDDWVAVAIVGEVAVVAFIRSGEESWTHPCDNFGGVTDACFYQGKLYAVNYSHQLVAIDFSQQRGSVVVTEITMSVKSPHPVIDNYSLGSYLVELERDLLLVRKIYLEEISYKTRGYKVRKLSNAGNTTAEWIDMDDLGKFSLFLGDNNESVAIYASSNNVPNFQPNCIYYTDHCQLINFPYEADDLGVYNLATGLISQHYTLEPLKKYLPAVVWISPKIGANRLAAKPRQLN